MLVDRYDCLLFDLDGVLYRGGEAIPGAPETLATLRRSGKSIAFITNNSSRTPEQVAAKLAGLGIPAKPSEVVTSALATADLLASRGGGSAYVIGGEGVMEALAEAGIEVLDGEPERVDLVVVGMDEDLTYAKLRTACGLIRRGAGFVATNVDPTYPAGAGELWPGGGAIVAAVATATEVEAEVAGKPHPPLFRSALRRAGGTTPLVIGDRLDTDIEGAAALGWDTMLVLTGVTSDEEVGRSSVQPTYAVPDVRALLESEGREAQNGSGRGGIR